MANYLSKDKGTENEKSQRLGKNVICMREKKTARRELNFAKLVANRSFSYSYDPDDVLRFYVWSL